MSDSLRLAADLVQPIADDWRLITAAVLGFAVIIVLIMWVKIHPFVALTIGALGVALIAGMDPAAAVTSFSNGFGATMGGVGVLVALGAMFGKLLADSGGADRIVDTLVDRATPRSLPWIMGLVGAVIGLPMFFEIGLVLLMPVIVLVARRSGEKLMKIAIPTLAGLSAMHALVPPHPGPLAAIAQFDKHMGFLGPTLGFGVLIAIPAVIIAGPLFAPIAAKWAPVPTPDLFIEESPADKKRPSFFTAIACILLPVVLMMGKAFAGIIDPEKKQLPTHAWDFLGTPMIALLIALIVAMFAFSAGGKMKRSEVMHSLETALPPIAGILLIVGAGGAFKQILVDTGIGTMISHLMAESGLSIMLLGWLMAVLVRLATGSATVAIITASTIMVPLAEGLPDAEKALLVLALGSGSVFLSHVNDAGFWLVKQYMGTSISQTFKTWSVLECLISVVGLVGVLLLDLVI